MLSHPKRLPQKRPESFRSRALRYGRWWLGCGLLLQLALFPGVSQTTTPSEYQVKAAFLYNFGKFVEWPDKAFVGPGAPLIIGIYGDDPFHGDLERMVARQSINGHPVVVRQAVPLSDLRNCSVVFINAGEQNHASRILAALNAAPVLTVTEDMDHFSESGLMIDLFRENDKVRFEINEAAAGRAGLKISPKLLNLARRRGG